MDFGILYQPTDFYLSMKDFKYDKSYTYLTFNEKWTKSNIKNKFKNEKVDYLLVKLGIKVSFGKVEHAYYSQEKDKIIMPYKRHFRKIKKVTKEQNYYNTLFHEIIHWTGGKNRLNRKTLIDIDEEPTLKYEEELIAEIGSNYLNEYFEISNEISEASLIYIKRYMQEIPEEQRKKIFKKAHSEAEIAFEFIVNGLGFNLEE